MNKPKEEAQPERGVDDVETVWGVPDEWGYDFYRFSDSGLPPMELLDCDKKMAERWYGLSMVAPTAENLANNHAWRISRERQLLAALAQVQTLQRALELACSESVKIEPKIVKMWIEAARKEEEKGR